jgi:hypothetical protein
VFIIHYVTSLHSKKRIYQNPMNQTKCCKVGSILTPPPGNSLFTPTAQP